MRARPRRPRPWSGARRPRAARRAAGARRLSWPGSHQTGRPPAASAAAPATSSPLTPGEVLGTLARGVHVQHHHQVGERQGAPELAREQARARVEMRLEAGHQPPRGLRASGGERGPHLGRMVGVVVEHPRAGRRAPVVLEAAARPGEARQRRARPRAGSTPAARQAASAASAFSTLWRPGTASSISTPSTLKRDPSGSSSTAVGPEVAGVDAVAERAAPRRGAPRPARARPAPPARRSSRTRARARRASGRWRGGRARRSSRPPPRARASGTSDRTRRPPPPPSRPRPSRRWCPSARSSPPIRKRGIAPGVHERQRGHRRGGGLAVGAGHGDRAPERAHLAEQVAAVEHRRPAARAWTSSGLSSAMAVDTTTSAPSGGGSSCPARGSMPASLRRAEYGRLGAVRAGDLGAQRARHQREAAHAGAADAHEVQPATREGSRLHGAGPRGPASERSLNSWTSGEVNGRDTLARSADIRVTLASRPESRVALTRARCRNPPVEEPRGHCCACWRQSASPPRRRWSPVAVAGGILLRQPAGDGGRAHRALRLHAGRGPGRPAGELQRQRRRPGRRHRLGRVGLRERRARFDAAGENVQHTYSSSGTRTVRMVGDRRDLRHGGRVRHDQGQRPAQRGLRLLALEPHGGPVGQLRRLGLDRRRRARRRRLRLGLRQRRRLRRRERPAGQPLLLRRRARRRCACG